MVVDQYSSLVHVKFAYSPLEICLYSALSKSTHTLTAPSALDYRDEIPNWSAYSHLGLDNDDKVPYMYINTESKAGHHRPAIVLH